MKLTKAQEKFIEDIMQDFIFHPNRETLEKKFADELEREREKGWNEGFEDANDNWKKNILPLNLSKQKKELVKELSLCNECYERNKRL